MKQAWTMVDTIIAELQDEGTRITKLRKGVLQILSEQKKPFSIDEIRRALEKRRVSAHLASLYREVEKLVTWNVLQPVFFQDSIPRYELGHHGHHHHVVCTQCKAIADVELSHELHTEERRVAEQTGFKVFAHSLEFFGLCKTCAST